MIKRVIVGVFTTNCYIYYTDTSDCIIIDPGWDEYRIFARIQKLKLNPVGIVFTHGHFDHTGATGRLKTILRKKGRNIKIAIHENDKSYIGENSARANQSFFSSYGIHSENNNGFQVVPAADFFLKENDCLFSTDLTVLETPGHTPGSICFYSEKDRILFSGDTLFNGGIGKTDFPGGSEKNLIENIKQKILVLPRNTKVYPGHGPETSIESERNNNPFIN